MRLCLSRFASTILLFGSLISVAQPKSTLNLPPQPATTPQSVEGGMWRLDAGFEATLRLKNVLVTQPLTVTPSLVMADGTTALLAPITLAPAGVATVNIGDALNHLSGTAAAHRSAVGMVSIDYAWSWPGALMASVQNIDETAMLSFQSSLSSVRTSGKPRNADKPQRVESGWWRPYLSTTMFAFLGNGTAKPKDVAVDLRSSTGAFLLHRDFHLAPHASTKFDLFSLLKDTPGAGDTGSLSLTYTGPEGGVIAESGLEDLTNGFSHTLHLTEIHPELDHDTAIHAVAIATPGVMFGAPLARMQFPQNTVFRPFLVLHNEASSTRSIAVSATWTQNGAVQQQSIGTLPLPGRATRLFDFAPLLTGSVKPDDSTIELVETFSGNENDIHLEAGSVDGSGNYVFDAQSRIEDWTAARTVCYWTVNGDTNTMVTLWNYSPKAQDLVLTLHFRGGSYDLPIHLSPNADLELDLATLIKQQKPDSHGHTIPSSILEGSATLAGAGGEQDRIQIAASTSTFNVRNGTCVPTCETCNGITSTEFVPGQLGISIGGSPVSPSAFVTYNSGYRYQVTPSAYWSYNSSIAAISGSGGITGVSAGDTLTGWTLYNQPQGVYICSMNNLTCPYQSASGSNNTHVIGCPTSITRGPQDVSPDLATYVPGYLTGMGLIADMRAGPSSTSFDGATLIETVSPGLDTCRANIPSLQGSFVCTGSSPFTVGFGGGRVLSGITVPDIHNAFYDDHERISTFSRLGTSDQTQCTVQCTQLYRCNGSVVGQFTIQTIFTRQVVGGYAVTTVQTTKQ